MQAIHTSIDLPDNFGFTPDHDLLRTTARRMLGKACPMSAIRGLAEHAAGHAAEFDTSLYRTLAEHGWTGMLIPEEFGGASMDHLSMALLLEETGRCLLPAPLWSTIMAGVAIELGGSAEQKARWLPALAAGERIATVAFTEPGGSWEPDAVQARARASAGGYVLEGEKNHVLWARSADLIVAPFVDESGALGLYAIDEPEARGIRMQDEVSVDTTRRTARLHMDGATVDASARLGAGNLATWQRVHVRGYVLLAAEILGATEAVLARTRDYALERVQFGRPIGAFQAVKHPLVNVLIAAEQARSLVTGAAAALDSAPERAEYLARMAKASATEALSFAVDRGVQFHGGYGFTWDCDMHFYFKRALWSAATLGDPTHHHRHLATHLFP